MAEAAGIKPTSSVLETEAHSIYQAPIGGGQSCCHPCLRTHCFQDRFRGCPELSSKLVGQERVELSSHPYQGRVLTVILQADVTFSFAFATYPQRRVKASYLLWLVENGGIEPPSLVPETSVLPLNEFSIFGGFGGTRTLTTCVIRTSNVRVYHSATNPFIGGERWSRTTVFGFSDQQTNRVSHRPIGGPRRDRTDDLLHAMEALLPAEL